MEICHLDTNVASVLRVVLTVYAEKKSQMQPT